MSVYDLLILQFLSHILTDFIFQTDKWVDDKICNGVKSKYLGLHIFLTFIFSWLLSFQTLFIFASVVISVLHFLFDVIKNKLNKKYGKYIFFIDQFLHLVVLSVCTFLYTNIFGIHTWFQYNFSTYYLLIITGYILCLKPSNIIIREILNLYDIKVDKSGDILNAGKLIGVSERIISLTFILYGVPEAVGFVLAGKSILRFNDSETSKTEYVLIGTLLSFSIAILIGIGIKNY